MKAMIVVTAPTGNISRQVVQGLLDQDAPVRVVARDPARLAPAVAERVEIVRGSHRDPAVVAEAFAGADAVFWLMPADPSAGSVAASYVDGSRPAAELLKQVGRVVDVSSLGRGTTVAGRAGYITGSLAMDDLLAETGVPFRALACTTFMDNTLRQVAAIKDQGVLYGLTTPDLRIPLVATRDIAAVAVRLLLDDTWTGSEEVPLLGPEDLSFLDVAATIADVIGRPVRYQQTSPEANLKIALDQGVSEAMAHGRVDMGTAVNQGLYAGVSRTPRLSALTPTTFRQFCGETLKPAVDHA
jgi:uncharacterized protein YbjT (DUF2867 family)